MTMPSICVFCGARSGRNPAHARAARDLGTAIARNGWRLVYGAGDVGLMGEVARAAVAEGARTLGVIPQHLLGREQGKRDLSTLIVTEDMHERKKVMFMNSDAVVVLPGGAGSLDEFFEVLTWAQIGLHDKPVFLLDIEGYWQPLIALLTHIVDEGFAEAGLFTKFARVSSVEEFVSVLDASMGASSDRGIDTGIDTGIGTGRLFADPRPAS
ncbi:MAG: TIGR00730 family Rossman fold protein [Rhodobacterales bacterium]|nr:TIGR00730 family Rossman fold protein [Rhodobacterales bacterium]